MARKKVGTLGPLISATLTITTLGMDGVWCNNFFPTVNGQNVLFKYKFKNEKNEHGGYAVLKNKNIISYFPKELFQRKKINYKDFIPTYRNFAKINKIKYEYLGIIYYLMSNKMNFKDLFN